MEEGGGVVPIRPVLDPLAFGRCRPSMAEHVLPLLVDKLASTHTPAKLESLKTLQVATRWGRQALSNLLVPCGGCNGVRGGVLPIGHMAWRLYGKTSPP